MSRILRRPMFRGGPASSDGVGITSGLNDNRLGYKDPTANPVGSFADRFQQSMAQNNANEQARYDLLKSDNSYDLANINFKDIYDALNPPSSEILKRLQERQKERPLMDKISDFVSKPTSASQLTYRTEAERQAAIAKEYEAKIAAEKAAAEKTALYDKSGEEEVTKRQTAPTMAEDIDTYTKLLMENAGPDKDEYTRQKYLTLAKFGLNLLKPTPVGIKPSLTGSIAAAAEKPLEEYGNISMQQSKEDRALRQAAVQLGIQRHMPAQIGKTIQDLMTMNPSMTAQEATSIATTGKNSAAIAKEKFNEVIQRQKDIEDLATKDPALKKLSKIDPTFSNTYAQIATEQGLYGHELKGLASDYNVYQPGSIYYAPDKQTGQLLPHKFIKGKFYSIREPEFKQKGI